MDSPPDLPAALARLDALQAELDAMRPLDPDALGRAMQRLRLEWTYHSNAIEGNSLTYGETRALLMHGVTAHGKPLKDHLDIRRHREVIEFVEAFVRGDEPVRVDLVKEIHLRLMGEAYEITVELPDGSRDRRAMRGGAYKEQPNNVRTETGETHYYADPLEVPARIAELVEWLTGDEAAELHPVVRAALFHHRFVEIHPFPDGNGRSARVLMNLLLMRAGYVPAVLRQEQRPTYYGALSEADGGDTESIVAFIAGELVETTELYLRALKGETDLGALHKRVALLAHQVDTVEASDTRLGHKERSAIASAPLRRLVTQLDSIICSVGGLFQGLARKTTIEMADGRSLSTADPSFERPFEMLRNEVWDEVEVDWVLSEYRLPEVQGVTVALRMRNGVRESSLDARVAGSASGSWSFDPRTPWDDTRIAEICERVGGSLLDFVEDAHRGATSLRSAEEDHYKLKGEG